jgi:iron complex outermembrane recepter protein
VKNETKRGLFATTLLAGLAFGAPAFAQQAAEPAAPAENESDLIVVTGSRIPQANLITTSPVTQISAEDITTSGVTRVEDLTNQLPQVFAAQGSNVSNGATGTAQVNLRGLGANRNLVLINGRRMPYGSPLSAPSDLNQIPGPLVERVEVLTGGASAVYGSDAITGVVNFIMKDDFEGFRIDGQYGFYQHSNDSDDGYIRQVIAARNATNPSQFKLPEDDVVDGYSKEVTLMFGASTPDDRGNITAYMSYRNNDAVLQRDRDYSACAIGNPSTAAVPGVPTGAVHWTCGGSGTSFPGYFYFANQTNPLIGPAHTINYGTGTFVQFTPDNQYNFGPLNYYQRPDERYSGGAFAKYEINEHAEVFAELMFSEYSSVAQIAPSGNFFATTTINCDNPLLTAAMLTAVCGAAANTATTASMYIGRRNVEGGGRQDDLSYQSLRMVAGVRGKLTEGWQYDLYAARSRVALARTYLNDFSITRLRRSLDVIDNPALPGVNPVCRSVVNGTDPNCVPWNIFAQNGVTPAALAYLQIPLQQRGETVQQSVVGTIAGEMPMKSPGASSPVAAVFGVEYRRDELNTTVDSNFASGDGAGQGGPTNPLSGHTDVFELFTEVRVPLLEDQPFAKLMSIEGAFRYSDYNNGTNTETYKVGADWAPTDDVRFRGSYQKAIRAPNIIELFAAQGAGLFNLGFDPCDNGAQRQAASPGTPPATCFGTNPWQVTTTQSNGGGLFNPAGQYNGVFGGNPNLEPEEAETITVGFVATPTFLDGLTVSVDYWNIEVTNFLQSSPQAIMANCYAGTAAGNLASCALITRNSQGRLRNNARGVLALNDNIGYVKTSGVDINVDYRLDVGSLGDLAFQVIGTKVETLELDVGGGTGFPAYDCVGKWSNSSVCGTPTPEWRHRARVSWSTPWNLELIGTWRYFGEVAREVTVPRGGTLVPATGTNVIGNKWDAENFFDFAGNYQVFDNTRIRFGVNNVLDEDPPIGTNTNTANGNTFPQVYDSLGRYVFVGASLDF